MARPTTVVSHDMRLPALLCLVMFAFAANSLLTRAGVAEGTDPLSFALIRVMTGAATLAMIAWASRGLPPLTGRDRALASLALTVYLFGFSLAYLTLDAGVGALILFAVVQIGLFAGALMTGEVIGPRRWLGMGLALAALTWLLWPGSAAQISLTGALWMGLGGLGWALYTWLGRSEAWALGGTAGNFLWASLAVFLLWIPFGGPVTWLGTTYAAASGIVASGLGYALWFHVLPQIKATTAGIAQLTVPVIALILGAVLLREPIGFETALACGLVLAGVALATMKTRA